MSIYASLGNIAEGIFAPPDSGSAAAGGGVASALGAVATGRSPPRSGRDSELVVDGLARSLTPPVFSALDKDDVVAQLRARIRDPSSISQRGASLCGPAVFLYSIARNDPTAYATYIRDLYLTGTARLGELTITPGPDCRAYAPTSMAAADWIGLAGLRDSENTILDYDEVEDAVAGITLPSELAGWFGRAGYGFVEDNTNLATDKRLLDLANASRLHLAGKSVCLFIGAGAISGDTSGSNIPNHWVVLTSAISIDGNPDTSIWTSEGDGINDSGALLAAPIAFDVYSWGNGRRSVNGGRSESQSVGEFLDAFYGYIAVSTK